MPQVVEDEDLEAANAARDVGTYGFEALGPLIAAALFVLTGIRGVVLVDVATFAISAALLTRPPLLGSTGHATTSITPTPPVGLYREMVTGLGHLWSIPTVRVVARGPDACKLRAARLESRGCSSVAHEAVH